RACHVDDVGRQAVMPNGVLGDELQESWISEVVAAFEGDALASEARMAAEVLAQAVDVAVIEELHRAPEGRALDALVMRAIEGIAAGGGHMALQARPTRETVLPGDGQVRVGESERRGRDFLVRGAREARMELTNPLANGNRSEA